MSDWWESVAVRRDKKSGKILVKRPRTQRWVDAYTMFGPKEVMVLDLVAGSREMEAKERRRDRERGNS